MPGGIFSIIDVLGSQLEELKQALLPLAGLASSTPSSSQNRGRGRPRSIRALAPRRARLINTELFPKSGPRSASIAIRGKTVRSKSAAKPARPRDRKAMSSKLRAMRKQQGQYLGALRQLTPAQRAQVKKAKANGDYASALRVAAKLGKKQSRPRKTAGGKKRKAASAQAAQAQG